MAEPFQPRFVDLVRNYTTTTGTANFALGGPVTGYRSFASAIEPGDSFYYSAIGIEKPAEFEVGRGTLQPNGTIAREPVGGTPTSFTSGNKTVALIAAAEWFETVQAATSGSSSKAAATRADLAALADRSAPVLLHEAGREGIFTFDASDLSAEVTADPAQGLYVAPTSDTSGATGAWVRRFEGPMQARWFGAKGDGIADDTAALQAAINAANINRHLQISRGVYKVSTLTIGTEDVTVIAYGATITSDRTTVTSTLVLDEPRIKVFGGTWMLTSGSDGPWHFDVGDTDCLLDGVRMVKQPAAGHYQAYIRHWATGFAMRNCSTEGSNGIYVEASNSSFIGNYFVGKPGGSDDCIAVKGYNQSCRNVRIEGNYVENLVYGVSIGSEIGTPGANDPTYSKSVGQVVFIGNTLKNCSGIAFIKPGGVEGADYRDGTVEDVVISDNVLIDEDGTKFDRGIAITPARGARVRNIYARNNIVRARSYHNGAFGRTVGAVEIYIRHMTGGTAEADVSGVDLQVAYTDPFGGQANGASSPGHPVRWIATADCATAGLGTMSDIVLDISGDGCTGAGLYVGPGLDDAVRIRRLDLVNVNAGNDPAAGGAGAYVASRLAIEGTDVSIVPAAGDPYRLAATGEILGQVDERFWVGQINPGNSETQSVWNAPKRCFVTRVEVMTSLTVVPSDANYTELALRHGGDPFHWPSTKATGGTADAPNVVIDAHVLATLLDTKSVTTPAYYAKAFFAKDERLAITKADTGAGAQINNGRLRIHWAPC